MESTSPNTPPEEVRALGISPDSVPTAAEIAAIPRHQVHAIRDVTMGGENTLIDLGWGNRLVAFWRLDGSGITVGLRLYVFGSSHELGSQTIDPEHPTVTISGPEIAGWQASATAGVDTTRCVLFIVARLKTGWGWPSSATYTEEFSVAYAVPWPSVSPGDRQADGITPEMAEAIRSAPPQSFQAPPPGFIQRDLVTTATVTTLLWLVNAAGYISSVRLSAAAMAEQNAEFSPGDLLFAIGISGQGGVGVGVERAAGVYITGDGEVGWFGSSGVDVGAFAGVSVAVPVYVFWTGTRGFGGASMGINIGVGKSLGPKCPVGFGLNVSIYWSLGQPQSSLPTGFCASVGFGVSPIPVQAYVSFGYTYVQKLAQVWGTGVDEVVHFRAILPEEPAPLFP